MSVANTTIRTHQPWPEVLSWLQQNVGDLLWSQPIVSWRGQGWHMKSGRSMDPLGSPRGSMGTSFYDVEFDDPKQAVAFALKWS
jgi:hypothetical protein